jgi:hypothetical protein
MGISRFAARRILIASLLLLVAVPAAAQSTPPAPGPPAPDAEQYSTFSELQALAVAYGADIGAMSEVGVGTGALRRMAHQASKRLAGGLVTIVPHPCYLGAYGALWQRVGALRLVRAALIALPEDGAGLLAESGVLRILQLPVDRLGGDTCPADILGIPPTPVSIAPPEPGPTPTPTPRPPTP